MTLAEKAKALDYYTARSAWVAGRVMLGDILPDHPKWGPVPSMGTLLDLMLQVKYLPAIQEVLNRPSPLMEALGWE